MGAVKTGALIVIEQDMMLDDVIRTGIEVDGVVTSQLLINIFEHNTPLHDGAVVVRGNRVVSATCYLPLTDSSLSKDLGTRHRAGVGISEVTDSITIIVSEETGAVSVAVGGELIRDIDEDSLRNKLEYLRIKNIDVKSFKLWRGRFKNEGKNI
jgi:diadenylate cyclase